MSKFFKKMFFLLCCASVICVPFTSVFAAWRGIQELDTKIQPQIIATFRSLLANHGILGDLGKSRNIVTIRLGEGKEICFVSGLLPISGKIKSAFSDNNPCYDFCDVLLGLQDSASIRELVDYFLSNEPSNLLRDIRSQKIITYV